MKLILISDYHLRYDSPVGRKDDIIETGLNKLKFIMDYAKKEDAIILQAGDFFDSPRSYRTLSKVLDLFHNFGYCIYGVFGQHDSYLYSKSSSDSTSLGILQKEGYVRILDSNYLQYDNIAFYGASWGEDLPPVHPDTKDLINILICHHPIVHSKSWLDLKLGYVNDLTIFDKYSDYDLILCGDIHRKFSYDKNDKIICNTGPILRLDAENYSFNHKPCFFLYDTVTKKLKEVEIPHEPAENVLSRIHLERIEERKTVLDDFISKLQGNLGEYELKEIGIGLLSNLNQYIKENNIEEEIKDIISKVMEKK